MTETTLRTSPMRRRAVGGGTLGLALAVATVGTGATEAQAGEYTVRPGDTVSHIALRNATTVAAISKANGLDRRHTIRVGQTLTIPGPGAQSSATAPTAKAAPAVVSHRVASGDTVSALAARYGTTVAAIVEANGLDSRAFIRAGQTLTIPSGKAGTTQAAPAAPATTTVSHRVASGDTVSALAARYGTTVAAIVKANGLDSRATIRIGQTLSVPAATAAGGAQLVGNTFAGRTYPAATVASANANKAALLAAGVPSKDQMRSIITATARDMGVDPALALAIAYQESGFNHASVSPANAIGAMQVIPSSGRWASDLVGRDLNLLDPYDNATAGVAILRQLLRTAPDLPTAIAGYYQGLAGVRKNGMYPDTRRYVANVQTLMTRFA